MIWMYLAGFISGAVGWHMFCRWMGERILRKQQMEAFNNHEEEDDR